MATVVITRDRENIDRAIDEALRHLPLGPLFKSKVVAVKPNETWATADDMTAVTHADTLRAVLRAIKQHEPRSLIVSGGSGAAETADVLRYTGMMDVVREESVEFVDHNCAPFVEVPLEYAPERDVQGPQRSVMVSAPFPLRTITGIPGRSRNITRTFIGICTLLSRRWRSASTSISPLQLDIPP